MAKEDVAVVPEAERALQEAQGREDVVQVVRVPRVAAREGRGGPLVLGVGRVGAQAVVDGGEARDAAGGGG